jgi:DNA repair protein RecN (Recombination protein N)
VGGAVATVIGRKLREVARHHQVLCITHLPQIAVFADRHFHVRKEILDGRTQSGITRLDPEARAHEIARMIGGEVLSPATLAAAREMLETARVE